MSFDTLPFLLFFSCVYACARLLPGSGCLLLAASAVCYAFAGLTDTLLFASVILVNFWISLALKPGKAGPLVLAVIFNAAVLIGFKYRNFLFGLDPASGSYAAAIAIPLGISFYTFQSLAYLVDIYRGEVEAERSLPRFALFKSFFPQLVAGPIVRAHLLLPQVQRIFARGLRPSRLVSFGLLLCLAGLIKQVVLADSLAPFVDDVFSRGPSGFAMAWLGIWLFAFQIYFDFSGYSDMAVGMARLLGIKLPLNFRTPYLAASPREFWQRWHITLSTWIRDYLYVPLGGSRTGSTARQVVVLLFVMGLAGLWHGANWTFLVWGLLWGAVIAAARVFAPVVKSVPDWLGWIATLATVLLLWVPFRAPSIEFALKYVATMLGADAMGPVDYGASTATMCLIALGSAALLLLHGLERMAMVSRWPRLIRRWDGPVLHGLLIAVIVWLLMVPKTSLNPFIYFRF